MSDTPSPIRPDAVEKSDRLKQAALVLQFFQTLGAVTVAALAGYAYFFTSLPQELTRQFQSEIADAKEQLIELRRERSSLIQETSRIREELATSTARLVQANQSLRQMETELIASQQRVADTTRHLQQLATENESARRTQQAAAQELETTKALIRSLKAELSVLESQRVEYLKTAIGAPLIMITVKASLRLKEVDRDLDGIRNLIDIPSWAEEERQFQVSISQMNQSDRVSAINRRIQMRDVPVRFYEISADGSWDNRQVDSYIAKIRKRAMQLAADDPVTGGSILGELWTRRAYSRLSEKDWRQVNSKMQRMLKDNDALLKISLRPDIHNATSHADLKREVAAKEQAIAQMGKLIESLFEKLGAE